MSNVRTTGITVVVVFLNLLLSVPVLAQTGSSYLPLSVGKKWVLRNPHQDRSVVFEVMERRGKAYLLRSATPWGESEWTLVPDDGRFVMTGYGTGKGLMPLPDDTIYFDFTRSAGSKWSNKVGTMSVLSTDFKVSSPSRTYDDCIEIRHKYPGGASVFVFAKGVGFVQFGEGKHAFVLDMAASEVRESKTAESARSVPPQQPSQEHSKTSNTPKGPFLIGLTSNVLATDPNTPEAMIKRFDQTLDTGVNFIVANGKWDELEPHKGKYKLDSLNYLLSVSRQMPVSYTLRIIDTIGRNVPSDLRKTRWNDPKMRDRLFRLIDELAPMMQGRVRWFMLGYEINEYMNRHPNEANDFIDLYRETSAYIKQKVPGIHVSSTLMFSGIGQLHGRLSALDPQLDFLALTYAPLKADFTVEDPSVVPSDIHKMIEVADGRIIVLQEIGYPSGRVVNSSQEKQSEFYKLAFQELENNARNFAAVNWMMLGDLSDQVTKSYTQFYGLKNVDTFAGALQTMGMFDTSGRPKQSWDVFRQNVRKIAE